MKNVVHKYSRPGLFTVTVECSTSEWHVTAQNSILIQEPLGEFGTVRCYSQNQTTDHTNCRALYNNPLNIEVRLDAGKYFFLLWKSSTYTINNKHHIFPPPRNKCHLQNSTWTHRADLHICSQRAFASQHNPFSRSTAPDGTRLPPAHHSGSQ